MKAYAARPAVLLVQYDCRERARSPPLAMAMMMQWCAHASPMRRMSISWVLHASCYQPACCSCMLRVCTRATPWPPGVRPAVAPAVGTCCFARGYVTSLTKSVKRMIE